MTNEPITFQQILNFFDDPEAAKGFLVKQAQAMAECLLGAEHQSEEDFFVALKALMEGQRGAMLSYMERHFGVTPDPEGKPVSESLKEFESKIDQVRLLQIPLLYNKVFAELPLRIALNTLQTEYPNHMSLIEGLLERAGTAVQATADADSFLERVMKSREPKSGGRSA